MTGEEMRRHFAEEDALRRAIKGNELARAAYLRYTRRNSAMGSALHCIARRDAWPGLTLQEELDSMRRLAREALES